LTKYKIEFDREVCIGALACTAVAENFWPKADDGKVDLTGATYNEQTKKWELIIDEKDFQINQDAADSCPVEAIKITKLEGNEGAENESTIKENSIDDNKTYNTINSNNDQKTTEKNQ
jgi:ferredoxin